MSFAWVWLLLGAVSAPPALTSVERGPIDFRCDAMQMFGKPRRVVCRENVVVRRGGLSVCCSDFEGYADAAGGWERFVCRGDVRAVRGEEEMWADEATFVLAINMLHLTGSPVLRRGRSVLHGERIVVDAKTEHARIERPTGQMEPADGGPAVTPKGLEAGPLPARCPLLPRLAARGPAR